MIFDKKCHVNTNIWNKMECARGQSLPKMPADTESRIISEFEPQICKEHVTFNGVCLELDIVFIVNKLGQKIAENFRSRTRHVVDVVPSTFTSFAFFLLKLWPIEIVKDR